MFGQRLRCETSEATHRVKFVKLCDLGLELFLSDPHLFRNDSDVLLFLRKKLVKRWVKESDDDWFSFD